MVTFITGTPGTGKTLNAVKRYIIPALRAGRLVYTNVPLSVLHISIFLKEFDEFTISNLIKPYEKYTYKQAKANSLLVIDEAQNFYNNRDFKDKDNKDFLEFLTGHRHYGIDVLILTQHYEQVDLGIRRNCETCIVLKSLRNVGFASQIKAEFYGNALDLNRKPIASQRWSVDSSYYSLYKSYANEAVTETKKLSFNVFLRSPLIYFMLIVVSIVVYNGVKGKYSFITDSGDKNNILRGVQGGTPPPAVPPNNNSQQNKFDGFDLGEYKEYYCGDKFYVWRLDGKIDSYLPKDIPPNYCPHVGFNKKSEVK